MTKPINLTDALADDYEFIRSTQVAAMSVLTQRFDSQKCDELFVAATSKEFTAQKTSPFLELPIEIIAEILKIACTGDESIKSCKYRKPVSQPGDLEVRYHCKLHGTNSPEENVAPKALITFKALSLTCRVFRNVLLEFRLFYEDNEFEFCNCLDVCNQLAFIPQRQRDLIRTISLHRTKLHYDLPIRLQYLFKVFLDTIDFRWAMSALAYRLIRTCNGLRNLCVDVDDFRAELRNGTFYSQAFGGHELAVIYGLHHLEFAFCNDPESPDYFNSDDQANVYEAQKHFGLLTGMPMRTRQVFTVPKYTGWNPKDYKDYTPFPPAEPTKHLDPPPRRPRRNLRKARGIYDELPAIELLSEMDLLTYQFSKLKAH